MKTWIKEKAKKITNGYKNPFTGEITDKGSLYVHFVTFACKAEQAQKYDSLEELIKATILK